MGDFYVSFIGVKERPIFEEDPPTTSLPSSIGHQPIAILARTDNACLSRNLEL